MPLDDPELRSQSLELQSLIEVILESLDEALSSDSDTDSEKGGDEDMLMEIIFNLRSRNRCLVDLSASLDRPAADADFAEPGKGQFASFTVSGPSEIWTRKVLDSYPTINNTLAERLGEANWQRYQRVSKKLEAMVPLADSSESDDSSSSEEDEVPDLPDFTETTKSSRDQSSVFSSHNPQSSGMGTTATSVSQTGFENRFPRRKRVVKDVRSQATYTSVLTDDQGERGWLKIPALPKGALQGKSFQCTVCGEKQKDIMNQTDWK